MRKFLNETKIIIIFFVVLTASTVLSLFEIAPEKAVSLSPQEMVRSNSSLTSTGQSMAQLKRAPAGIDPHVDGLIQVDVNCEKTQPARFKKTNENLVMLSLNICDPLKTEKHIWIKNESNGFKAQTFKTSEKNFKTDFIQLNNGTNKLSIESILKDGQKRVQSLEIISGS